MVTWEPVHLDHGAGAWCRESERRAEAKKMNGCAKQNSELVKKQSESMGH